MWLPPCGKMTAQPVFTRLVSTGPGREFRTGNSPVSRSKLQMLAPSRICCRHAMEKNAAVTSVDIPQSLHGAFKLLRRVRRPAELEKGPKSYGNSVRNRNAGLRCCSQRDRHNELRDTQRLHVETRLFMKLRFFASAGASLLCIAPNRSYASLLFVLPPIVPLGRES